MHMGTLGCNVSILLYELLRLSQASCFVYFWNPWHWNIKGDPWETFQFAAATYCKVQTVFLPFFPLLTVENSTLVNWALHFLYSRQTTSRSGTPWPTFAHSQRKRRAQLTKAEFPTVNGGEKGKEFGLHFAVDGGGKLKSRLFTLWGKHAKALWLRTRLGQYQVQGILLSINAIIEYFCQT